MMLPPWMHTAPAKCVHPSRRRRRQRRAGAARQLPLRGVERCEDRLLLTFHLWKIDQVYSSADGKAQFIEMHDPVNGENHTGGHFISSNEHTFTFPADLPSSNTANQHFLIATAGYAALPGAVTPDYIIPDNFFSPAGDTFDYADVDSFSFTAAQMPTDGVNSLMRNFNTFALSTGPNSESNLAGQTGSVTAPTAKTGYLQVNLVSDTSGSALIQDPSLVNPWGVSLPTTGGALWVSDNGTGVSTLYTGDVAGSAFGKVPLTVTIPNGAPTGQVANTTSDFVVGSGSASGPAKFIFASENGGITGWNPTASPTQAQTAVTVPGAVYKGVALANDGTANELFATNFAAGTIDAFDASFHPVTLPAGAFTDPILPAGFAPFGIDLLNGKLFVSYAKQDAAKHDDVAGFGNGFIDVYNLDGTLAQRLVTGQPGDPTSPLNSPWGMAIAPANFGDFSGDLLVGNFGDGKINAFDTGTGAFLGTLGDAGGNPIVIDGLWGLVFGNGAAAGSTNTLFFTAGSDGEQHGLFGSLTSAVNTPLAGEGAKLTATEGSILSGTIAEFTSADVGSPPSDFSTTIQWGDGSSSAGTIVANGGGGFNVLGSHKFTEEGSMSVAVAINDANDDNFTMNASVSVADAALAATGVPISLASGLTLSNASVATFTDAGGIEATTNYTATIDWGDGSSASPGTINGAGGTFTVTGSHTYATQTAKTVTVTITDEGGSKATATASTQSGYLQLNLVADRIQFALTQDRNLVNSWGLAVGPSGPFWVADNDGDLAAIYGGDTGGAPFAASSQTVSIHDGAPTGQVFNGTGDFVIGAGTQSSPATRIFASENGAIDAWSAQLSPTSQALSVVTTPGAVYKGLAIGANAGANFLFVTDFHDDRVDVFDKNFQPVHLGAGAFSDPNIPAGFAPFGIENLGGKLYVTFAKQDGAKHDDVAAPGNGFVDVFDTAGNLLDRLIVGSPGSASSPLNSPWGVTLAPADFGDFGGDLLVGNFGDGRINAFDPNTGVFLGSLSDASGNPIVLPGLWGLTFGNGNGAGDANTLFFTSGPNHEIDGLFGSLQSAINTPLAGVGSTFSVTEGAPFNFTDSQGGNTIDGSLATINDVAPGAQPTDFTATIDWGDGSSSAGSLVADQSGGFDIVGGHTYSEEGAEGLRIAVRDAAGHTITINAQANVADAPLSGAALAVAPAQAVTLNDVALATFTDTGGAEPAANYSATIDWGDGTSATAGTVSAAGGTFTVAGSHTYAAAGFHTIAISVKDEGGATLSLTTSTGSGYLKLNLVSDLPGTALVQDPSLLNPWGIALATNGPFWISDNGADVATIYGGDVVGSPLGKVPLTVSIPDGAPTGQVFNATSDFVIGTGATSGSAAFIFASENGDIDAWSGKLSPITQALSVVTTPNAVYKGLAIGSSGGANFLFATDFHDDRIDVFDKNFQPVHLGTGAFSDPNIPAGFAPFGIQDLGGKLYVTYAKQNGAKHDDVAGFGNGFVDIYDTAGNLMQSLIVGRPGDPTSPLNSPWGLAIAPANFGDFSGDLLVGNFGNGRINAFKAGTGAFLGTLSDAGGNPMVIDGLWGLVFGNGAAAGSTNTLFFTAGSNGEADGLFGSLQTAFDTPLAGEGATFSTTEGAAFSGNLATFADTAVGAKAGDFTATIVWGDGGSSSGTIAADGTGGFLVSSSHTYTEEGNDAVQIVISDAAAHTFTLKASATVADAALAATGVNLQAANDSVNTNAKVATFTDAGGAEAAANYTAVIDWGDGTTSSAGTIVASGGSFTVTGGHTYHLPGAHTVTVTIKDDGGATATATATATVGSDDERFIEDVFRDLLGRDVDEGGLAALVALLNQGLSHAQLVQIVTSSPEFHTHEVQGLFQLFLHRQAEAAAIGFFGDLLAQGGTTEQVEAIIVSSTEYFQARGGGTRDGFLDALYADALHREVDSGGRSFWDAQGNGDVVFRAKVAEGVFGSEEFLRDLVGAPGPSDSNPFHDPLLDGFFPVMLGRDPDPAAVTFFENQLKAATSDGQVLAEIIGSNEFTTRV